MGGKVWHFLAVCHNQWFQFQAATTKMKEHHSKLIGSFESREIWCSIIKNLETIELGMHIICDFQFDTYHNTFCLFSIRINDTNLHGNSSRTTLYHPVHPKT